MTADEAAGYSFRSPLIRLTDIVPVEFFWESFILKMPDKFRIQMLISPVSICYYLFHVFDISLTIRLFSIILRWKGAT